MGDGGGWDGGESVMVVVKKVGQLGTERERERAH